MVCSWWVRKWANSIYNYYYKNPSKFPFFKEVGNKQILGLQFYRQKPLLNFIVDFYCPSANLVVECDGSQHYTDEGLEADRVRNEALTQLGLKVLRFDNGQVIGQIDGVVEVVFEFISQKIESP